jgi:site-specific DNA-methyltransferase (adenine-specific)
MTIEFIVGDCIESMLELPKKSINCCVTSPPYWGLRDYGIGRQLGLESTPEEYIERMVNVFRGVRRVLMDDGTVWLNLGDSYASNTKGSSGASVKQLSNTGSFHNGAKHLNHGVKPKDLVGIPWRMALALQAVGWYLRSDIIWHKTNPMPESVTDRPTKSHEYVFLLSKNARYYYDHEAIKEPSANLGKTNIRFGGSKYGDSQDPKHATKSGNEYKDSGKRNKRSVWILPTKPYKGAHFAVFPPKLIEPCILAGCPEGGTVLDPFCGSGTTGLVAQQHNRNAILCDLNPEYIELAKERINNA